MDKILMIAVIAITLALVFYTIGVWWERKEGTLKSRHVIFFLDRAYIRYDRDHSYDEDCK